MDWRALGWIGLSVTLLLTLINAAVRDRERRAEVHPWIKNPPAWIQLIMIPAGAVTAVAGWVAAQGAAESGWTNAGIALIFSGMAGLFAMDFGDVLLRKPAGRDIRTVIWRTVVCLLLAFFFWARTMTG